MVDTVVPFGVDNMLLDNDRVHADPGAHLAKHYGDKRADASTTVDGAYEKRFPDHYLDILATGSALTGRRPPGPS